VPLTKCLLSKNKQHVATLRLRSTVNQIVRKTFPDVGILICATNKQTNKQRILKFVSKYEGPNWSNKCFIRDLKVTNHVSALNHTISQCFMMRCVHAGKKDNATFIIWK
jgi:hypothetical protein